MIDRAFVREAEQALIATALVDPDQVSGLLSAVKAGDFSPPNDLIWRAIVAIHEGGSAVNQATVAYELAKADELDKTGGQTFLGDCVRTAITEPAAADFYSKQVRARGAGNEVRAALRAVEALLDDDPDDALRAIGRGIDLLSGASSAMGSTVSLTSAEVLRAGLFDRLEGRMDNPHRIDGTETGWGRFDRVMNGLQRGSVYLYGAETSLGKSQFGCNLIWRLSKRTPVIVFTTEMDENEVGDRLVHLMAGVNSARVVYTGYSDDERRRMREAMGEFGDLPILFERDPNNFSMGFVLSAVRRRKVRYPELGVVLVDHLDQMQGTGANRTAELLQITRGLKTQVAMGEQVAVVEVSQLNRLGTGKATKGERFRDGKSKEDDANVAWLMQPVEQVEGQWVPLGPDEARAALSRNGEMTVRLDMTKKREGPLGSLYFRLSWANGGRYDEVEA